MLSFENRVAIVTGAGNGLGRQHALALARRGAKVLVNDLGGDRDGRGGSSAAAEAVAQEIIAAGGQALANGASVTDAAAVEAMVAQALAQWGRVDILINNAGVLRDKTFSKMTLDDFRFVMDVHLMGAVICTKAVWEKMREQNYGRILMTTSSTGLYGNFGQSNYGAAKLAQVGLMQTLALEGAKFNIRVNALAPAAATRMTEDILPPEAQARLQPQAVSEGMLHLVSEQAPTRAILCAGGGAFEAAHITLTRGIYIDDPAQIAEGVAQRYGEIQDRSGEIVPDNGLQQAMFELDKLQQRPR